MSTFNGYITEIPYISVDKFEEENRNSKMFFLSHCHSDHMKGLHNNELRNMLFPKNVFLYASAISLKILRNMYPDFKANLKELPLGVPYSINVPVKFGEEKYLCVTTIPAGHCPGSVMFLFKTEGKTILYTGDFRFNARDLCKNKAFHDAAGSINKLDVLYLDTTFCSSVYEHFPSREDSVKETCKLIEEWTSISDKHIIDISLPSYYGLEYLFEEIFKRTNNHIHPLEITYELYKYVPDMTKMIVTNSKKAKIHTRWKDKILCCNITRGSTYFTRTIKPSAIFWENFKPSEKIVDAVSENLYRVCYSSHASLSEIREFVKYLKPLLIVPCVVPENIVEKENLFCLLDEMVSEHVSKIVEKAGNDRSLQFPLMDVTGGGNAECVGSKKELDLLASPPRNFVRKRRISQVDSS